MQRLKANLSRSGNPFGKALFNILAKDKLSESDWEDVEDTLLLADVGAEASEQLVEELRNDARIAGKADPAEVRATLRDKLLDLVGRDTDRRLNADKQGAHKPERHHHGRRQRHRQDHHRRQTGPSVRGRRQEGHDGRGRYVPRRRRRPARNLGRPRRRARRSLRQGRRRPGIRRLRGDRQGQGGRTPTCSSSIPPAACRTSRT